ncbi:MAG TPA: DUF167 domain-containing protein [Anaerolineales bacterium]|nr:DUF167 domain-containing protein [Anaerolineales bacterium]HNB40250.1 DUF167 domain-containing protein [Anaerolineales bacterium]HND49119.1 DUF167 domain-containing protein [Anaerolineales bacterium]HNF95411.1 DUF167 domain-containing protein [Anaerolineales bacterium]HNH26617.1 DUF167 domain-containing protein [Anaerolineales bacterium]
MSREYVLHDGKRGSALAVRITPRASRNQIAGVLNDGTVKIQLAADPDDKNLNSDLLAFLAEVLGVPRTRVEIVAGESGRDKLISVLDMDVETVHQRIVAHVE